MSIYYYHHRTFTATMGRSALRQWSWIGAPGGGGSAPRGASFGGSVVGHPRGDTGGARGGYRVADYADLAGSFPTMVNESGRRLRGAHHARSVITVYTRDVGNIGEGACAEAEVVDRVRWSRRPSIAIGIPGSSCRLDLRPRDSS